MGISNKIFNGKLNLDVSPYRLPPGDFLDALNISIDAQAEGSDRIISNVNGNQIVPYTFPSGQPPKCIGKFEDVVRNRIYDWIWSPTGHHLWRYYDQATGTITTLIEDLTDTNNVAVLDFNPSKRINHVDIIYRDDDGDLVFWTDGNTTPKKANVENIENNVYTVIKSSFIEAAKKPFLSSPTCVYGSDTTRAANSLRRKLFQFTARGVFDDFEKATFSTYSKIPLPIGFYGSDNDFDNTFNNYITVTVETGDENVAFIEIAMRNNIANVWGDFVLVASLDKDLLNIPDNTTYDFLFYNDQIYPPIDITETIQLFDWLPQLADAQAMGNGDTPIYGAITEGYNNYPVNELDVTITSANVTNSPPDTDPPAMSYINSGSNSFEFTVSGSVPTGTLYKIVVLANIPPPTVIIVATYTSTAGNTVSTVGAALYAYVLAHYATYAQSYGGGAVFALNFPAGSSILQVIVQSGGSGGGTISTEKTWMWRSNYVFGLVYVDEQNRDMPGVTTFVNPVNTDNDFAVTTDAFSLSGANVQTPVISAEINHLPPDGAVAYYWVRRRLTYGTFLMYETCDYQSDTDNLYFCLANIDQYKLDNSQFIYGTAPITTESRIQVIAGITAGGYDGDIWSDDYQILGTVTKTLTGGVSPDDDRLFIKVNKPTAPIAPAYKVNMLVMVYTPALNPTSLADSVYWEWGEQYDIYTLSGINYHRGMDQDQTSVLPATFTFEEGDVYFHQRVMYSELLGLPPYNQDTLDIMDANFSDFFDSAVNDNGRAQAIEVNARRQYNPVLVRFGGAYQAGTNINQTNRFYFDNFDEYDRGYGDIRKLFIDKRYMYVFQRFDIGVVPIFTQIIKDTSGNPLEANSDQLLNKIGYPYQGKFGIGDVPESFAFGKGAKYFIDSNKGVACRLSQDGIIPISILYECNAFFVSNLAAYGKGLDNGIAASGTTYSGNPTVYGVFDAYTNKYIIAMEEINRYSNPTTLAFHQDAQTITFLETRDSTEGFESKYSFHPEMMGCLNNLLITWKNGAFWKHDGTTYANFYGVQYEVYITPAFNDNPLEKKTFISISEIANNRWDCPEIFTDLMSYGTTPQQSNLVNGDFAVLEGQFSASFLRDSNSIGGIINGDALKGKYMTVKLKASDPSTFIFLNIVTVKYIDSPLTVLK